MGAKVPTGAPTEETDKNADRKARFLPGLLASAG